MRVQIILHQNDFFGLRKVLVRQILQGMRVIDSRAAIRDLHVPPTFERCKKHKEIGGTVAFVFIIGASRPPRLHLDRFVRIGDQLLRGFIKTDEPLPLRPRKRARLYL